MCVSKPVEAERDYTGIVVSKTDENRCKKHWPVYLVLEHTGSLSLQL